MLEGQNGEFTPMNYLTKGDRFEAIHSAMASMALADQDTEWVQVQSITITRVDEK